MLKVGLFIVLIAALAAIVGPAVAPFDPSAQELALRLAAPTPAHPLGLDELGRDILARVLAGARISFPKAGAAAIEPIAGERGELRWFLRPRALAIIAGGV